MGTLGIAMKATKWAARKGGRPAGRALLRRAGGGTPKVAFSPHVNIHRAPKPPRRGLLGRRAPVADPAGVLAELQDGRIDTEEALERLGEMREGLAAQLPSGGDRWGARGASVGASSGGGRWS